MQFVPRRRILCGISDKTSKCTKNSIHPKLKIEIVCTLHVFLVVFSSCLHNGISAVSVFLQNFLLLEIPRNKSIILVVKMTIFLNFLNEEAPGRYKQFGASLHISHVPNSIGAEIMGRGGYSIIQL